MTTIVIVAAGLAGAAVGAVIGAALSPLRR